MIDYLEIEKLIVATLKSDVPELNGAVLSSFDMADKAKLTSGKSISCHVIYEGDTILGGSSDGKKQQVTQNFIVAIVVKLENMKRAKDDAGPIILKVLNTLQGKKFENHHPLKRVSAPNNVLSEGVLYYPLGFSINIIT